MRWARDLICGTEVGRCGYMGMLLFYIMSRLEYLGRRYHITCVEILCLVCIVVVVLCVLLSSYVYLLYCVCIAFFF